MLFQVIVCTVGDSFQLAPSHGKKVLDVNAPLRVEGEFVFLVLTQPDIIFADTILLIPSESLVNPPLMPLFVGAGHDEEFNLHLFELTRPKRKVPRRYLVAERFPDLCDAKRQLFAHGLKHVVEVDECSLGCLRPEISLYSGLFDRAEKSFEHQTGRLWLR